MALQDLKTVPEWYEFRIRYQFNLVGFAVEVLGMTKENGQELTWQQELLFDSISIPGSRTSVASGHGCFGKGTPIMLATGDVIPVEDVKPMDRLMGGDGSSFRTVLELRRGSEAMYRFTYSDGTSHVFNESHILCLVATNSKGKRKSGEKKTVTVREWLTWGEDKKRCHAIYRSPVEDFAGGDNGLLIDPYILGVWLGDGHSAATSFTTEDHEIKTALINYANSIGCTVEKYGDSGNAETLNITRSDYSKPNPMRSALRELGVFRNKHIPQCYMTASRNVRLEILAGLMDTDGFLDNDGAGFDFVQKSERMARQVAWLARSVGCHATVREVTKTCCNNGVKGQYWRVTIGRNISQIPTRIARKQAFNAVQQRKNLHFGIKNVEPIGIGDYYGFVLDGDHKFLGGDFTVLHNTGKTRSAGVTALWHLLCFPDSVMMFTAPQIGQLRKLVWKEIAICYDKLKNGPFSWLADYVVILAETVYIKGFDKTWHVIAKTAPKHQPTNIAGQHGDNYFLWVDEASGVDDAVMDVVMGALTHADNRAVMTSQPTRNAGFFYDSHHKLSHRAGGVWTALTFNGEESPLVTLKTIREMLQKYGHRDDPGYMIRVRGLFPDRTGEFLLGNSSAEGMWKDSAFFTGQHDDFGYVIAVDVGGGVGRDDSVIMVAKVWGEAHWGERARRAEVIDIPLCKNSDNIDELVGEIDNLVSQYPNATLVLDANGAGRGLAQRLKGKGIYFIEVHWGGQCFSNEAREHYANKRSQAIVCMTRAAASGRLKIVTRQHRQKLIEQVTRLPYAFDDHSRYKVMSKETMKLKGLKSPDMADALAFLFLDAVNYVPAGEQGLEVASSRVAQSLDEMARLAEAMS